MKISTITAALCLVASAAGAVEREYGVRPDVNGKQTRIPVAKTFDECVANSVRLGHPRVGPAGKDDPRGAVGYCSQRFPR